MFIIDDQKQIIINVDHVESIYTEDEQHYLYIRSDYYTYSKFYGDKTKEVLNMIMAQIEHHAGIIYLPTNDDLEEQHEDTDSIVPDCCFFCETIPEETYDAIYHSDGQGYIASFDDNEYYLCSSADGNGSNQAIKIKYCPVCGRKLGG